ncbi:helix-turn-helix domain-containing protein [Sphingomonas sp. DT-51]|uniref:helix-turn-helix domain-containing protein n=1 Tax=Sphingomonas sp. DT-51 TaxID=3396165 RepID=UPI003F1E288D
MSEPAGHNVYSEPYRRLVTRLGEVELIASRTTSEMIGRCGTVSAPRDETFGFAYQLAPMGGDEFWNDDGYMRLPAIDRGSIHIADMRAGGTVRFADTGFDSLNVGVPMGALREIAERSGSIAARELRVPDPWITQDPFIKSFEPALLYALEEGSGMGSLTAEHLILSLLYHLAITYGGMSPGRGAIVGALAPEKLRMAQALLMDEIGPVTSLAELARVCDLSPSHFSRAFKRATGKSPSAWLAQQRVARAKDLLLRGELSLTDIAYRCGFADQSHFTRSFSRSVGLPPGSWRRLRR